MGVIFDYSKLKGKIKEIFDTQAACAKEIPMSTVSLSFKLNNKVRFDQQEINRLMSLLSIDESEISLYFFTEEVKQP